MESQAYFEDIQKHILDELEKAESKIVISVAWLTDRKLFNKLCQKSSSGIMVELMIYYDKINKDSSIDYAKLEESGGKLYKIESNNSRSLMHNKFCVIDFKTVINGSFNWSNQARRNHENITVSTDAEELALQFIVEFERLKKRYYGKYKKTPLKFDSDKILKRLSLIKNLIDLGDLEDIPLQVARLKTFEEDESLNAIISALENREYSLSIERIEKFSQQEQQLKKYIDPQINALKLEIYSLEIQLKSLSDEQVEIEKLIYRFNVRHTQELGYIINEILFLRKQMAETREEKEEAEKDEEEYKKGYNKQKDVKINLLNKNEKGELKKLFRKASKLCHPDVVEDKYKKQAGKIFIRLKSAYEKNDYNAVIKIFNELQTGIAYTTNIHQITEKEQLEALVKSLRIKVKNLLSRIDKITNSDEYQFIAKINDWDAFFNNKKDELRNTLKKMRDESGK